MQWADNFGLTSKTNIELTNEAVGWIGNQDILYDPDLPIDEQRTNKPTLVYNRIYEQLQAYGEERGVTYSEEQLKLAATELVDLARLGRLDIGPEIRQVLSDTLDIPQNVSLRRGWTNDILNWLKRADMDFYRYCYPRYWRYAHAAYAHCSSALSLRAGQWRQGLRGKYRR